MAVQLVGYVGAVSGHAEDVDAAARNTLGLIAQDNQGGEYIYLSGVASVSVGSWVTYDENGVTALLTANAVGPVAVAMAAVTAGYYGWFCIKSPKAGVTGKCDTIADNKAVFIDGTDGRVDDAVVTGDLVLNAFSRSTDSSNLATFQIDHPSVNDNLG